MKRLFILIGVCFSFAANSQTQPIPVLAVSVVKVPVISVAELNKSLTTQASGCVAKTDPSFPKVEGAISESHGCVGSDTKEVVKTFKVVYEYSGRQYAVELPENPGANIQLQLISNSFKNTSAPEGMTVIGALPEVSEQPIVTQSVLTYPYVYYSGVIYRPMPIFVGGTYYRYGGGYRFGRGRRH